METIDVIWQEKRDGNLVGRVSEFSGDDRDKIVLLDGYYPKNRSFYEGLLPEHGEEWRCEIVKDSIHPDVYKAYDDGSLWISDNPRCKKYVEKFKNRRTYDPRYLGALIVRLIPGENLGEKRQIEKEKKLKSFLPITKHLPIDNTDTLDDIVYMAEVIAHHKLLPAIRVGAKEGIKAFYRKIKSTPEAASVFMLSDDPGNGLEDPQIILRTFHRSVYFQNPKGFGAQEILKAIYAWITRDENTGEFSWTGKKLVCKNCQGIPNTDKVTEKKLEVGEEVRISCEFCGKNSIIHSEEKALA